MEEVVILVAAGGAVIPQIVWLASLRRTPWAGAWYAGAFTWSALIALFGWIIAVSPHTTLGGELWFVASMVVLALVAGLCTEIVATEKGSISGWREPRPIPEKHEWIVESVITDDSDDVQVRLRNGTHTRPIGELDVDELDHHAALNTKGQELASTLNALDVRVEPGKSVAKR